MAESMGGDVWSQVLQAVQGLSEQVEGLSDRMDKLDMCMQRLGRESIETRIGVDQSRRELRAEIQGVRTELMAEFQQSARRELRTEIHAVRMELQLGLHHVHERIDRTRDALLMSGLGLYRTVG